MNFRVGLFVLLLLSLTTIGLLVLDARRIPYRGDAGSYVSSCGAEHPDCAPPVFDADASARERLATTYAPIVYLPQLDRPCQPGGSSFAPLPVEIVLDNREVMLRKFSDSSVVKLGPSGSDLFRLGSRDYFDAYLDLPGDPSRPGCRYERDGLRFAAEAQHTVYARIFQDEEPGGLYLQYWLFYYFNDWNNKHEGDWELVQLYFDAPSPRDALAVSPLVIGLSQHSGGEVAAWSDEKLKREGPHPVVHVARGSHANYFSPGVYLGRGEDGRGLGCDDASLSSRRITPAMTLLPERVDGSDDSFAWLAYKGYWGEADGKGSEGSTALVTKQTWLRPAHWQAHLMPASVSLPSREVVGPDAARAFCDAVAVGSEFLIPFLEDVSTFSLLAIATLSAGVLGSLVSVRYLPAGPARPGRGPRLPRSLTDALDTYRSNLYAFVTIGLLMFPLGIIAAQLYSLGNAVVPKVAGALLPFGSISGEIAAVVAFRGMHAGLATLVVMSAAVMIVAGLHRPGIKGTDADMGRLLRRLPAALLARGVAMLIVLALCLSVVGIPLALRQALRWAFVDHAVLVGGHTWLGAFRASAGAVAGNRVRVAGFLVLLGTLAAMVAPTVGIGLLMVLKSVPPVYWNLVTSSIYALLLPYFAIVLSLLYLDLQRDRDEEQAAPASGSRR